MKNSAISSHRTGEGIVIDIGTGDGRFVSTAAKANPNKFFIGVDANVKPLEKPSMKATRKPAKGGLPNALFVQAAVEDLPEEFDGVADEIHIHFPWGSLLRAVAAGDTEILSSLRRIASNKCLLEIAIGVDIQRDRSELDRLGVPEMTSDHFDRVLFPRYTKCGFQHIERRELKPDEWRKFETTWARKLSGNESRKVYYFLFEAI